MSNQNQSKLKPIDRSAPLVDPDEPTDVIVCPNCGRYVMIYVDEGAHPTQVCPYCNTLLVG